MTVVIIQNNVGNKYSPTVIIAAVTSKANVKAKLPTHYYLEAGNGLAQPSLVLLEQIRTIDKQRLSGYIGRLDEKHIRGINHALAVSIGLIEPVPPKLTLCLCGACALVLTLFAAQALLLYGRPRWDRLKRRSVFTAASAPAWSMW